LAIAPINRIIEEVEVGAVSEHTTVGVFLRQAERLADRVVMRHHDGKRWVEVTWAQLRDRAIGVACHLVRLGVDPGDRVLLMSENRIEWLFCDSGIQLAAAITVPIYPSTTAKTAQQIAGNSKAVLAIVSDEKLAERLRLDGDLRTIVRMDREIAEWADGPAPEKELTEVERRLTEISPDDMVTVIYTSGTTGEPKGVVLAHRNFVDMAHASLKAFTINEDDVALSFLPYAHVLERVSGIFVGQVAGASAYLARGMDRLMEDIGEVRPTLMVSVPRMYEKMYERVQDGVRKASPVRRRMFGWAIAAGKRRSAGKIAPTYPLADRLVLSKLRTALTGGRLRYFVSGGAPLAAEVEAFFWAIGVKILQGWGMTETTSGATSNTETNHRYATVGRALPGTEIRVAEDGEVMVKGPGVMLGYFQNEDATEEVLSDGWMHTGDIGEIDKDGFLKITDRKKDLIKTAGGKYVAPQPIEAALQHDPLVERAVVIGDERPYCVALIVPNWDAVKSQLGLDGDHQQLTGDAKLRGAVQKTVDNANQGLGSWESVKYFKLLPEDFSEDSGEITPTLKVKRRIVQERHAEEIEELYATARKEAGAAGH
jgi:long-chain acyl-CoA synthetase